MGRYTYQKRPGQPDAAPRQAARSNLAQAVPNSAALDMLDHVQERPQAQIPAAEAEADRLSASVTSGGPEAVKAAMGRRLGADFSGIRFHMGDQAEAKAEAMNARAYTSGADIYFGEGGFDPSVAAHELVHTAQQGVVAASTPTVATPVGGVQRIYNIFSKKAREEHANQKAAEKAEKERQALIEQQRQEAAARQRAAQATAFVNNMRNGQQSRPGSSLILKRPANSAPDPSINEESLGEKVESAADVASVVGDYGSSALDFGTSLQEAKFIPQTGINESTGVVGGVNIATGLYGAYQDVKGLKNAKDKQEKVKHGIGLAGNLSSIGGGAATIAKAAGSSIASSVAPGFDIATGAFSVAQGARQVHEARKQVNGLNDFMENNYGVSLSSSKDAKRVRKEARNMIEDSDDRILWDSAVIGKMEGTRGKIKGSGKIVTGAVDAAAGIAELSGAGAAAGVGIKAGSLVAKGGFAIANQVQKRRVKNKVLEQTGMNQTLDDYMQQTGITDRKEAKHTLLKAMGYESGKFKELVADQINQRASRIIEMAKGQSAPDSTDTDEDRQNKRSKAASFLSAMGIETSADKLTGDAEEAERVRQLLIQKMGQG